jgi:hypothetical protein
MDQPSRLTFHELDAEPGPDDEAEALGQNQYQISPRQVLDDRIKPIQNQYDETDKRSQNHGDIKHGWKVIRFSHNFRDFLIRMWDLRDSVLL